MIDMRLIENVLMNKLGATKEYKESWELTSYKVGGKIFATTCTPGAKYAEEYANHPLVTFKCDPADADLLQNMHNDILSGFYMDKRFWVSVRLDGDIEKEMVEKLCDQSYELVFSKLTKKLQKEILENAV